jgi:hypothetical protein
MKIMLPEGFKMPDTAKPGQPFEVVATLVMGEDGVNLTALDGMELAEAEAEGEMEEGAEMEEGEEEYAEPEIKLPFEQMA